MITVAYNREQAVSYALRWGISRNPVYHNFDDLGGDCTNFVSQSIYAGSGVMNYKKETGWYYNTINDRAPAWTGVRFLYNFMVNNSDVGPFAEETEISAMEIGDFIQLGTEEGHFYHSLFITKIEGEPDFHTIFVSTHTFDAVNRPLNSYFISKIRFLHIKGVRKNI